MAATLPLEHEYVLCSVRTDDSDFCLGPVRVVHCIQYSIRRQSIIPIAKIEPVVKTARDNKKSEVTCRHIACCGSDYTPYFIEPLHVQESSDQAMWPCKY